MPIAKNKQNKKIRKERRAEKKNNENIVYSKTAPKVKIPWAKSTEGVPLYLNYYEGTMYQKIAETAIEQKDSIALDFMGSHISYSKMLANIDKCAKSLKMIGVRPDDKVTIALPNCPQAIYMLYAINSIGAIANMVHPLSAEKEIEYYLNESDSIVAITLDQFYPKFEAIRKNTKIGTIIVTSVKDVLTAPLKVGYDLTEAKKIEKIPDDAHILKWNDFMKLSNYCHFDPRVNRNGDDYAAILYSGGTTGTSKGVILSNKNFNTAAKQIIVSNPMSEVGDRMLAAMPIFHGFGLGVCIHTSLFYGFRIILIPRFTPKSYAKDLLRYKCNYIAGVPTLYEALLKLPSMENADLSFLKGVFSGGDSLSIELKKKFDNFLKDHGSKVQIREGYGATETVTACCLTPVNSYREGSIGIPFPDTYFKIVAPNSHRELPYGKQGEIVIAGPQIMQGYMNHKEETSLALQKHKDGLTWLHTGDLGVMDKDGYVYFKGRAKRMIISSGYNIYPSQLENVLDGHESVAMSCVIGIPDSYKIQKVKAYVKLNKDYLPNEETKESIMNHCRKHLAKYEMPYDIEFKEDMPKTLIGKVAYRRLEEEELKKIKENEKK